MRSIINIIFIVSLASCTKLPPDASGSYSDFGRGKFYQCIVFVNDTTVVISADDSEYFWEARNSNPGMIFSLVKDDLIIYSAQSVSTAFIAHCDGADCYYTYEYLTSVGDTFHCIYHPLSTGSHHLLREYPFNIENIEAQLQEIISPPYEITSLWNYYEIVD